MKARIGLARITTAGSSSPVTGMAATAAWNTTIGGTAITIAITTTTTNNYFSFRISIPGGNPNKRSSRLPPIVTLSE